MNLRYFLAASMLLLLAAACEQISDPVRVARSSYPAAPAHLTARVLDRSVRLTWTPPPGEISRYFIFRSDSLRDKPVVLDSSVTTGYLDTGLLNGQSYIYQVAACNTAGLRGGLSTAVSATPGLYSMTINSGALYTNSFAITLGFIAPAGTRYVKIGQDSSLTGASWQLYSTTMEWTFMPGDGLKHLYAIFLDGEGNQSATPVTDDIHLDTRAAIQSLEITNGTQPRRIGDVIKLRMRTGEANGQATVTIGSLLTGIHLYDDGSHGDLTAADGLYSHDYIIPPVEDQQAILLTGNFTDIAGNASDAFTAIQTLTIENPPAAVTLFRPERLSRRADALHLSWTVSSDADFSLYKLFRSTAAAVDSTDLMVAVVTTAASNHAVDSLLSYDRDYYYRLYVYDRQGLASGSNVVTGHTAANLAPEAVVLQPALNVTATSAVLSWSQSSESDFAVYRLFRSSQPAVSDQDYQVALISARTTTQQQESGLAPGTTYWYRLYTVDQSGNLTGSNTIEVTTLSEEGPAPVVLAAPVATLSSTLRLTWSASLNPNFANYRLYRGNSAQVDNSDIPIVILNSATVTTHDDVGLSSTTSYYYRLYVYDLQGRSAGSNVVKGTTLP